MGLKSLFRKKSPWVLALETGGCNGCIIEVAAALTPRYDVERFGILRKPTPRHADILVITGAVTHQIKDRVVRIYEQMPEPKFVIAVGVCPTTGGMLKDCYNTDTPLDEIIPVDAYVPGCPPKPEAIIDGIVKALEAVE
jgi:NADH-quinone oxidoreductase B subunit